ncbi:MAG: O-antigen ligase family protein [Acidobacteria bacterium]|nr:O-antigen ligase family protein [Acidobacteriota bacterium]
MMNTRALFESAVYLLLSFAVTASAATPPWARAILCAMAFLVFAVFLVIPKRNWATAAHRRPSAVVTGLLLLIPLLQLVPLPAGLLKVVSPVHAEFIGQLIAKDYLTPGWNHRLTSIHPYNTLEHLLLLLAVLCIFWMARRIFTTPEARRRLFVFLVALGLLQALLGLLQYFGVLPLFFPARDHYEAIVASGTYVNRNHFAGLLEMVIPLLLGFTYYFYLTHIRPDIPWVPRRRKILYAHPLFPVLLLLMFLGLLLCLGIIFSMSRTGIFCMLATLFFLGLIISMRHGRRRVQMLVFLFMLGVVCYAAWIGLDPVIERFDQLLLADTMHSIQRIPVWQDSWKMILDFPWLGVGLGNYEFAFYAYNSLPLSVIYNHAHNDYLEYAADLGIPGALLLFGAIVLLLGYGLRVFFRHANPTDSMMALGVSGAIFSILTHSFTDFNLQIPANMVVFAVLLAVLSSVHPQNTNEPVPE